MRNPGSEANQQRSTLVTLALGLSTFLTLFDDDAVVVALPGIAQTSAFSGAGAAWVIDATASPSTGALVVSGALPTGLVAAARCCQAMPCFC